jgi:hypothetical protein
LKKLLARKLFQKRLERKPEKRLILRKLFSNPIGVITSLLKKSLSEKKPSNEVIGVVNWPNGCSQTVTGQRLL